MNKIELKNDLIKRIAESPLSKEDKDIWSKSLESAPHEIILAIHSFFLDYSDKLQEATIFLKQKIAAINDKNPSAWNSVIRDEELFLNQN